MSLAPNALTDAATVQARLRLADGVDTTLIEQLINEASAAIETFCGRELTYNAAVSEQVAPMGGPKLLVSRTPLLSIASITLLFGDSSVVVDPADYAIDDGDIGTIYRRFGWPWSAQLQEGLNFDRDQQPGTERRTCTVVYAGGYVTEEQSTDMLPRSLPYDLERACVITAIAYYRGGGRDPTIKQETVGKASRTYANSVDMPDQAKEISLRYARWS